jgi:hypothetical protein
MGRSEQASNALRRRTVAVFCGAVLFGLWMFSRSEKLLIDRVFEAGGYVNTQPAAPAWVRNTFGDTAAAWFDTPTELGLRDEIPDGVLGRAAKVESLRVLDLDGSGVSADDLTPFAGHRNLHRVVLRDTAVGDEAFAVLESLPALRQVSLELTHVTPQGIAAFRKARPDVQITIDPATEAGLGRFARLYQAGYTGPSGELSFGGAVSPGFFDIAAGLSFDSLKLSELRTGDDVVRLVAAQHPSRFHLRRVDLTPAFVEAAVKGGLCELVVEETSFSNEAAKPFASVSIESVSLRRVTFGPGAAQTLAGLYVGELRLADMRLGGNDDFGGVGADRITLNRVDLADHGAAVDRLRCRELTANSLTLDPDAARRLTAAPSGTLTLSATGPAEAIEAGLATVSARRAELRNVHLTEKAFAALASADLESLALNDVTVPEGADAAFAKPKIRRLEVDRLTDVLAQALAGSDLRELSVSVPVSGDAPLESIGRMRRLRKAVLCLSGTTDAGLAQLASLPELRELEIYLYPPIHMTRAGLEKSAAERPDLRIRTVGGPDFRSGD